MEICLKRQENSTPSQSLTCELNKLISGEPSSAQCEKQADKVQLPPSTTGGQAGPLAIPEIISFAIGPRTKSGGDVRGCSTWPRSLECPSLLVAHLDASALTFATLHVVPGSLPSRKKKFSGQVPSTHTLRRDTLMGSVSQHTWH